MTQKKCEDEVEKEETESKKKAHLFSELFVSFRERKKRMVEKHYMKREYLQILA